jgi:hypothetical protein
MSVSYPSSICLLLYIQSTSSHTLECFHFYPWNNSPTEWQCTPDRRRLYRMLWGKSPSEWYSSAKFGSHVSLFSVPIFGVNTLSNPTVVGVADRVKTLAAQGSVVLSLGLGRMISSPHHLRLQSIEVGSEACLVHLAGVKGLVKSSLECTGRRGTRGLMLMICWT